MQKTVVSFESLVVSWLRPGKAEGWANSVRTLRANSRAERGSSLAWNAIFLAAVLLPLMALVIDGARLFYVRGKVQTALDAACEDAAWSGADHRAFRDEGHTQFLKNMAPVIAQARDDFYATLGDRSQVNFNASVSIFPDPSAAAVRCYADASVPLAMYLGEVLSMRVEADAAIRFGR